MSIEFEAAAADSVGSVAPGDHFPMSDNENCPNCGAPLTGRFCNVCGQLNTSFHRPVVFLIGDIIADTFDLDGRLFRTIPTLMLTPGRLTRSYLDGQRARYMPPFRLFLVSSLIFFLLSFTLFESQGGFKEVVLTPAEAATAEPIDLDDPPPGFEEWLESMENVPVEFDEEQLAEIEKRWREGSRNNSGGILQTLFRSLDFDKMLLPGNRIDRNKLYEQYSDDGGSTVADVAEPKMDEDIGYFIVEKIADAYENQKLYIQGVKEWAPRVGVLLLPIFAFGMMLLYFWHRSLYIYDHLIVSLHYQSFFYLFLVTCTLLGYVIGGWAFLVFFVWTSFYLYKMQRVVYGTGRILTFVRTWISIFATFIVVLLAMIALFAIGVVSV